MAARAPISATGKEERTPSSAANFPSHRERSSGTRRKPDVGAPSRERRRR
jgi:hypothetical protein